MSVTAFLAALVAILAGAKLFGELAERVRQPAVLGELVAGAILGPSVLGWVDPHAEPIHLLAELGVLILLFEIGLETDLRRLLRVGSASAAVATVGVLLPLGGGYALGRVLGFEPLLALFLGAALTATSVGITGRVLTDLGRLQEPESQVVLGAAVIDDILGLVVLAVVAGLAEGSGMSGGAVALLVAKAFGFVAVALVVGRLAAGWLLRLVDRLRVRGALFVFAFLFALVLAVVAEAVGSAFIVGAFAAGLLLAETGRAPEVEGEFRAVALILVPIFFVSVGAVMDVRLLNPLNAENREILLVTLALTAVAVVTKMLAGYAPFWMKLQKHVIGVGMVPRGEVGLIFAQVGLAGGVLAIAEYNAVTLMVMATTFLAPLGLRALWKRRPGPRVPPTGVAELVAET
ncbi:MAG: cation:proton antiporter [Gemmatimonadetes bacterium]|nr:cation:proton antiporter [Gemmatimonadota bacterium]